ncbi:MAG: type IV pilus assembly protein PilM [Candidatus Omnitrophica bacterium]|nr:type IV pilus assembly protein PilM [Candidatus Omnitrophota bacterium]
MSSLLKNYFGLIRRFIPKKEEGSSVGIDIGVSSCKIVELAREGDSFKILHWAVQPVAGGDVEAAVRALLNQVTSPVESVFTSVYGKGTLIRFIEMPRMNLEDLKASFAIEADKYFPFSQDQIYTDCFIIDPQGKSKKMRVMAAAVKKEMVGDRLKMFNALGYESDFIGLNAVALANAGSMLKCPDSENEIVGILDVGETVSSFIVLMKGIPQFVRDISTGGRDLTKRIANALALEFSEAERLKCNPADRLSEIQGVCDSAFANLMQELRLSVDYFMNEHNQEINRLVLTGGASLMHGLAKHIESNLEIKVEPWNPFEKLARADNLTAEELAQKSNRLAVALGLALYQYD